MTPITINLTEGSIAFSFTAEGARELRQSLVELMQGLKSASVQATTGNRPQPQPNTEYRHVGDVFLEVFCNPNIYPTPFAAKALLTVRSDRIRVSTEVEIPRLLEDLDQYLDRVASI